jgi:O-antigen/teichoic acid export membrane protein
MLNISKALLTAAGKPGWTFILTGPMVPLSLLGYLLMIPRLGGVGAAIVVTLVAVLGALASMFAIYQTWGILPPLKTIFKSVLISGCVIFITTLWPVYGFMLILKLIALAIFIVLIFLLFGEFSAKEIALIRSIIRFPTASKQNEGGG